jgi:hypothetical protein
MNPIWRGQPPELHDRVDRLDEKLDQYVVTVTAMSATYDERWKQVLENQRQVQDQLREQTMMAKTQLAENRTQHAENQERMRIESQERVRGFDGLKWWFVGTIVILMVGTELVPHGAIAELIQRVLMHP